jgi:nitrogen fixation protein FixH
MRFCVLVIAAVVVLTCVAIGHNSGLLFLSDPTAFILRMRDQVSPFRFALTTDPEPPDCSAPVKLKVHVTDSSSKPADGLFLEADVSMANMDHGAQHVTLRGKGNGDYEGRLNLEMAGSWNVDLTATKGNTRTRQRLSIEVSPGNPRTPDRDEDES